MAHPAAPGTGAGAPVGLVDRRGLLTAYEEHDVLAVVEAIDFRRG